MSSDDKLQVLVFLLALGGVLLYSRFAKPRFIVDEHGERQYVKGWNRGQPVYDPKTWQQRIQEEALLRRERRGRILGALVILAPLGWFTWWLYSWVGGFAIALVVIGGGGSLLFMLAILIANVAKEIAYQSGYQGMQGAKVLDARPTAQPGREVVEAQKAHGDARLAGEAEAVRLLNSKK